MVIKLGHLEFIAIEINWELETNYFSNTENITFELDCHF